MDTIVYNLNLIKSPEILGVCCFPSGPEGWLIHSLSSVFHQWAYLIQCPKHINQGNAKFIESVILCAIEHIHHLVILCNFGNHVTGPGRCFSNEY